MDQMKMQHDFENINFMYQLSPYLPQKLYGDKVRIHYILHSLSVNSIARQEEDGAVILIAGVEQNLDVAEDEEDLPVDLERD